MNANKNRRRGKRAQTAKLTPSVAPMGPIQHAGDTYCGQQCGCGCKYRAYRRAVREAVALAKALGPGWTPYVWENLGWHYSACRGIAEMYPRRVGSTISGTWTVREYSLTLELATHSVTMVGKDPQALVPKLVQQTRQKLRRQLAEFETLAAAVAPKPTAKKTR